MCTQLSQQVGTIRQASEQRLKVAFEPPIKGTKPATLERKQDADGHRFTRIQFGTCVLLDWTQTIVDMIENVNDNLFGSHGMCLPASFDNYSLARFMTISTRTNGYYLCTWKSLT